MLFRSEDLDPEDMVKYTLSYMKGGAVKLFAEDCYDKIGNGEHEMYLYSWALFKAKLRELFEDKNAAIRAEQAIQKLTIDRNKDIRKFLNEFDMLANQAEYDDFTKRKTLVKKIDYKIGETIALTINPTTYEQWKSAVEKAYIHREMYQEQKKESKPWTGNNQYKNGQNQNQGQAQGNTRTTNTPKDPNAMDIDWNKMQGSGGGRPVCFKCNQPGHIARNCRTTYAEIKEMILAEQ